MFSHVTSSLNLTFLPDCTPALFLVICTFCPFKASCCGHCYLDVCHQSPLHTFILDLYVTGDVKVLNPAAHAVFPLGVQKRT